MRLVVNLARQMWRQLNASSSVKCQQIDFSGIAAWNKSPLFIELLIIYNNAILLHTALWYFACEGMDTTMATQQKFRNNWTD